DESLTSLKLPKGLKYICSGAFRGCESMTGKLELPESLLVIGDHAFGGTGFTGALKFPSGLISIGESAFSGCRGITFIAGFPETLTHIKDGAFSVCEGISGELVFPDGLAYVGKYAFTGCVGITGVTFGNGISSIGPDAFGKCEGLKSAEFTGAVADYYGQEEKHPSFPEECVINAPASAVKRMDIWKENASKAEPGKEKESGSSDIGVEREVPYYWTSALTGEEYVGEGKLSDVVLLFDDDILSVKINGRELLTVNYEADMNADPEDRTITTNGFFCRDGWIESLSYDTGFYSDDILTATMVKDDGSKEEVRFHTGSEESLYIKLADLAKI
ncbi:MAG: leucine-rich repeat domain-containing protein, partial [Oribacterium sp.]|nr:leucine-rich repeat domain-containing protein [Oribacterium sp.]